jgi:hypothetical protein
VRVTGAGTKRISMAALICTKAGRSPFGSQPSVPFMSSRELTGRPSVSVSGGSVRATRQPLDSAPEKT